VLRDCDLYEELEKPMDPLLGSRANSCAYFVVLEVRQMLAQVEGGSVAEEASQRVLRYLERLWASMLVLTTVVLVILPRVSPKY
jgi:hypothetical protein